MNPRPPRVAATDPIDRAQLAMVFGRDPQTIAEVLDELVAAARADRTAIDAALTTGAGEDAARFAHRIAGAATMLGANALARAARRLETAARTEGRERCRGLSVVLANEIERVAAHAGASAAPGTRPVSSA